MAVIGEGITVTGDLESKFAWQNFYVYNISQGSGGIWNHTFNVSKAGYTPIAVAGYSATNSASGGTLSSYQNTYICTLSGNTVNVMTRNLASSSAKFDYYIQVLYVKN